MTPEVTLTAAPSGAAQAVIGNGLGRYNASIAGYNDSRPLAVLVSDPETHAVVGGLPDDLRGHRLGGEVMAQAEDEAKRRGCRASVLYTISFQAPGFYERHGYRVFGTIPCDLPGTSRIFFVKEFA